MMMITYGTYDEWRNLVTLDPVRAQRALADAAGDLVMVVRVLGSRPGLGRLCDSSAGGTLCHAERAYAGLLTRVSGGYGATAATFGTMTPWIMVALADRHRVLIKLADEFARLLYLLNIIGQDLPGPSLASDAKGQPYWHVARAHIAVLTLLTGDAADGHRLHDLWADNMEDTAWNLRVLETEKNDQD